MAGGMPGFPPLWLGIPMNNNPGSASFTVNHPKTMNGVSPLKTDDEDGMHVHLFSATPVYAHSGFFWSNNVTKCESLPATTPPASIILV